MPKWVCKVHKDVVLFFGDKDEARASDLKLMGFTVPDRVEECPKCSKYYTREECEEA